MLPKWSYKVSPHIYPPTHICAQTLSAFFIQMNSLCHHLHVTLSFEYWISPKDIMPAIHSSLSLSSRFSLLLDYSQWYKCMLLFVLTKINKAMLYVNDVSISYYFFKCWGYFPSSSPPFFLLHLMVKLHKRVICDHWLQLLTSHSLMNLLHQVFTPIQKQWSC
jgi:hypothetical protein